MPTTDVVVAGCWRSGKTITLFEDGKRRDNHDVIDAIQRARAAYRKEREIAAKEAANRANDLLLWSKSLDYSNPYIVRKAIDRMPRVQLRARSLKQSVLLDMIDAHGEIVGAQIINPDGGKKFLSGTAKQGAWHWLMHDPTPARNLSSGELKVFELRRQDDIIAVVEGWATGCAVANLKGLTRVAVAFDAGNLVHVVKRLLVLYPHNPIVIFADDDDANPTGKQAGKAGAEAARVLDPLRVGIEYPAWRDGKKPEGASDFNDLFVDSFNKQ